MKFLLKLALFSIANERFKIVCSSKGFPINCNPKGKFFLSYPAGIEIAGRTITSLVERKNAEAVKALKEMGVTLHDWSREDRLKFRNAALNAWQEWKKKSPEAAALIDIHTAYMKANGIL